MVFQYHHTVHLKPLRLLIMVLLVVLLVPIMVEEEAVVLVP